MDIDIKNDRFENVGYKQREQIANEVYDDLKKMKLPISLFLGSYLETFASTITALLIFAWAAFGNEVWIAKNLALFFIICGPIIDLIIRPYMRKIYDVTPYQIIRKYAFLEDGKNKNIAMKWADILYTDNELSLWKFYSICLTMPFGFMALNYLIFLMIPNIELHTGFNDYYHYLLVIFWAVGSVMRIYEDVYECYYIDFDVSKRLISLYSTTFYSSDYCSVFEDLKKKNIYNFKENWSMPAHRSNFLHYLKLTKHLVMKTLCFLIISAIILSILHLLLLNPDHTTRFLSDTYSILIYDIRYNCIFIIPIILPMLILTEYSRCNEYYIQKIFIKLQKIYYEEKS